MILLHNFEQVDVNVFHPTSVRYFPEGNVEQGIEPLSKDIYDAIMANDGVLINELPQLDETKIGTHSWDLYYNKSTNTAYYIYTIIPKTPEEIQADKIASMQGALDDFFMNVLPTIIPM